MPTNEEILRAIQEQVEKQVIEHQPKFAELVNKVEEQFKGTPISIRLMTYEIIFTDLFAKIIAGGSVAFGYSHEDLINGMVERLRKTVALHTSALKQNGEHNVHANSVGEELRPEQTKP